MAGNLLPNGRFKSVSSRRRAGRGACSSYAGTLYGVATGSTYSLEDVAASSRGPKMFLLYMLKDRGLVRELIERCKRAGYSALCLMVDVPVIGKRERDLRTGFNTWPNGR